MKVFESIKESKWRTFCKSMRNQKALNHTNELARILFVKVQETQKLKINSPRWMHLRRNITYECLVSQSISIP